MAKAKATIQYSKPVGPTRPNEFINTQGGSYTPFMTATNPNAGYPNRKNDGDRGGGQGGGSGGESSTTSQATAKPQSNQDSRTIVSATSIDYAGSKKPFTTKPVSRVTKEVLFYGTKKQNVSSNEIVPNIPSGIFNIGISGKQTRTDLAPKQVQTQVFFQPTLIERSTGSFVRDGKNIPTKEIVYFDPFGSPLAGGGFASTERKATVEEIKIFKEQTNVLQASDKQPTLISRATGGYASSFGDLYGIAERRTQEVFTSQLPEYKTGSFIEGISKPSASFLPGLDTPLAKNIFGFTGEMLGGAYEDIRQKPLKNIITFGVGFLAGAGAKGIETGLSIYPKVSTGFKVAGAGTGIILSGGYLFDASSRFIEAPTLAEKGAVLGVTLKDMGISSFGFLKGQQAFTQLSYGSKVQNILGEKPTVSLRNLARQDNKFLETIKYTQQTSQGKAETVGVSYGNVKGSKFNILGGQTTTVVKVKDLFGRPMTLSSTQKLFGEGVIFPATEKGLVPSLSKITAQQFGVAKFTTTNNGMVGNIEVFTGGKQTTGLYGSIAKNIGSNFIVSKSGEASGRLWKLTSGENVLGKGVKFGFPIEDIGITRIVSTGSKSSFTSSIGRNLGLGFTKTQAPTTGLLGISQKASIKFIPTIIKPSAKAFISPTLVESQYPTYVGGTKLRSLNLLEKTGVKEQQLFGTQIPQIKDYILTKQESNLGFSPKSNIIQFSPQKSDTIIGQAPITTTDTISKTIFGEPPKDKTKPDIPISFDYNSWDTITSPKSIPPMFYGERKAKPVKGKRSFFYQPSLVSRVFGFSVSKVPQYSEYFTGLTRRPVIMSKRKSKRVYKQPISRPTKSKKKKKRREYGRYNFSDML